MDGQKRTVEPNALACHARCVAVDGCRFFAWWPKDGGCHITAPGASLVSRAHLVFVGPTVLG